MVETRWTDFSQGTLLPTGNPLNLALSGKGFFALNGSDGHGVYAQREFSDFQDQSAGVGGRLYAAQHRDRGDPIMVDPAQAIAIGKDGVVTQGGQSVGQIEIGESPTAADAIGQAGQQLFRPAWTPPASRNGAGRRHAKCIAGPTRAIQRAGGGCGGASGQRNAPVRDAAEGHEHRFANEQAGHSRKSPSVSLEQNRQRS